MTFQHSYESAHDYTVNITFDPLFFDFLGTTPALTDLIITTDIFDNIVVSGTYTAPVTDPVVSGASLLFHMKRLQRWDNFEFKRITYTLTDPICDPSLLATFNPPLFCAAYTDLTILPTNSVAVMLLSEWILPCGAGTTDNVLIDDELDIDQDHCFISPSLPSSIALFPGAKVTVRSGNTLTLQNMNIFSCGTELGQGIVVEPGATLVMDGCTVSDSRFGIDAQQGSTISVTNTAFADNYIGARLHMEGTPNRVLINAFGGNSFSTDNGLKAPFAGMPEAVAFRGLCGISVSNYRDFNLWGGNDFKRLANGILSWNSSGNLGNMSFTDMNGNASVYGLEGFGIHLSGRTTRPLFFNLNEFWTTMTFDDCKTGIYAFKHALNIENTTMTSVDVGIDVAQCQTKDVVLDGNTITARRYGIRSFLNEPVHPISAIRDNTINITGTSDAVKPFTGIEMEEGAFGLDFTGWTVVRNPIALSAGGRGILYRNGVAGRLLGNAVTNNALPSLYTGIKVEGALYGNIADNMVNQSSSTGLGLATGIESSAGWNNTFQCNCVDNTNVGMQFYDMADFTDAVRGNRLNNHCVGLQLGTGAVGGASIGWQYHTGNIWDLDAIEPGCFGGVNYGDPTASRFFVNGTANPSLNPPVSPSSGWFTDELGTTFTNCNSCDFPNSEAPPRVTEGSVPTSMDNAIATDAFSPDVFENEMTWKGKYRLYRKILRQPAIESYATDYADFMDDHENLSSGKLAYIAEEKAKLFALSATEDSILESRRVLWQHRIDGLRELDSLLQAGASVNQTQYENAVEESADAQDEYEAYLDSLAQTRQTKIQTLLSLNAAASTSLTPDANHKTLNFIVLKLLLADSLASGHLATLAGIAEQCPLEGGDAVYEARAFVTYLTGDDFDDAEVCADTERGQRPNKPSKSSESEVVVLYPNPTTGQIAWSGIAGQPVVLRIFNAMGQLQMEQVIVGSSAQIGQLPEGLYQVQLLNAQDKTLLISQKVLFIKH
ncbi:MAG: T9SS type A sorting domain-containing protein [Saprospiraceae bacterium]|nr:T9SS type A sorting domain-containing protein [Saprospiraceae bacterium]